MSFDEFFNQQPKQTSLKIQTFVDYNDPNLPDNVRFAFNEQRKPTNAVFGVLDFLSRGQYASAAFTDTLLSQGLSSLPNALYNAGSELYDPQARLSYRDIFDRYATDFSKSSPYIASGLGLALDIALDPLTYTGFGLAGKGRKVGGAILNEAGEAVFKKIINDETIKLGEQAGKQLLRESSSLLYRSNETLQVSQYAEGIIANILKDAKFAGSELERLGFSDLIGKSLTQDKGFRVYFGLGKRELELPIYKATSAIFDSFGITTLRNKLANVTKESAIFLGDKIGITEQVSKLPGLFNKDYGIAPELTDSFRFYENFTNNIQDNIIRDLISIKEVSKDVDFNKITKALTEIDSLKSNTKSIRGFLTNDESIQMSTDIIKRANLSTDEQAIVMKLYQKNNDINFVEQGVDLLTEQIRNFDEVANSIIKNTDDYLRYKQAMLDGTLPSLVASNPDLQTKIFSLDTVKDLFGKKQFMNGTEKFTYGKAISEINEKALKDEISKLKISNEFKSGVLDSKGAIINTIGDQNDLNKFISLLTKKGFEFAPENLPGQTLGNFVDDVGQTIGQLALKNEDGSLVRILREQTSNNKEKFTIIKSVVAPNEELAKSVLKTNGELTNLSLNSLKSAQKVSDDVILDPFANAVTSIYKGGEFQAIAKDLAQKGITDVNALQLYAQRAFISQKEQSKRLFEEGIKIAYKAEKLSDLPKEVQKRITFLGEGLYSNGMDDASKAALQLYDKALNAFKFQATALRPAFAPRQIIQNPLQYLIAGGSNAFKVFDPRVLLESAGILIGKVSGNQAIPDFISNALYKSPEGRSYASQALDILYNKRNDIEALEKSFITNPMGQKYSFREVLDTFESLGVLKGGKKLETIAERDLIKEVAQATNQNQGVLSFLKESLKYYKYPQQIEDFYRLSYAINGLRSGYDFKQSAKLVDKALFDYQGSLSQFERRVLKRIIPFYTFQRNAIPLIAKSIFNTPGINAGVFKGQQTFFDVWNKMAGGQNLTENERRISPDFIFEQASVFKGKDEKGNLVFNTFNNYTPYDAINLIAYNDNDEIDPAGTFKKVFLATISPFIKMNVEVGMNRLLFSDRVLTESNKVGGIGTLISSLPKPIQDLLGAETTQDPISGKQKTYINPYLAYTANSFLPILNDIVRPIDPDKTIPEKLESLFGGIQTYKYDVKELERTKALTNRYEIGKLKSAYQVAIKQGRPNEAQRRLTDLRKYLVQMQEEASYKNPPLPEGIE